MRDTRTTTTTKPCSCKVHTIYTQHDQKTRSSTAGIDECRQNLSPGLLLRELFYPSYPRENTTIARDPPLCMQHSTSFSSSIDGFFSCVTCLRVLIDSKCWDRSAKRGHSQARLSPASLPSSSSHVTHSNACGSSTVVPQLSFHYCSKTSRYIRTDTTACRRILCCASSRCSPS